MPIFGRDGFNFNQLMVEAGLMSAPELWEESEGDGVITLNDQPRQAWRAQVQREETPIFVYFYDEGDAEDWLEFFNFTTTRELREVARTRSLNPASLVSLEDGRTPQQMTREQVDLFFRVLLERTGEADAINEGDDISIMVLELEDGDNPQVFRRIDGQWEHLTSQYRAEEIDDLLTNARESPIQMYSDVEQPRFIPAGPTRIPASHAA